jgi:hypothetical protein
MKIALVQFFSKDSFWHYFIAEHIRLFYSSLVELGFDVVVQDNAPVHGRVNILFAVAKAETRHIRTLLEGGIDYVVYQPEILSHEGLNPTVVGDKTFTIGGLGKQGLYRYLQVLYSARMVWEVFPFNIYYLEQYGIKAHLCPLGHHPSMDGFHAADIGEQSRAGIVFFGSSSEHRVKLLGDIEEAGIACKVVQGHNLIRDIMLQKASINLSIPIDTQGMNHISPFRVYSALNHGCMTLSTRCRTVPSLDGLVEYVSEERLIERIVQLLESGESKRLSELFRQRYVRRPMSGLLERMLPYLGSRIRQNVRAGQGNAMPQYEDFVAPVATHLFSVEP